MKLSTHHEPRWDVVKRIINESDLVLEVLDARLVELSRNEEVERLISEVEKPVIFVVNKCDLVSKEKIREQVEKLKEKGRVVFISTKKKGGSKILLYAIRKVFKKFGKRKIPEYDKSAEKPRYREAKADVVVGILGYPNVGKSSIINALAHKKKVKTSKRSGTTHGIHWINISGEIKLLDSPGVIPLKEEDEVKHGLIGAKDTEALKNPELVAYSIIKLFLKQNKSAFEKFYKTKIKDLDAESIIERLAKEKGFLLKKGTPDKNRFIMMIIRDWQQGRLRL